MYLRLSITPEKKVIVPNHSSARVFEPCSNTEAESHEVGVNVSDTDANGKVKLPVSE